MVLIDISTEPYIYIDRYMDIHIHTDIPDIFLNILKGENLWQPGIQEVLEALH